MGRGGWIVIGIVIALMMTGLIAGVATPISIGGIQQSENERGWRVKVTSSEVATQKATNGHGYHIVLGPFRPVGPLPPSGAPVWREYP